MTGTQAIVHFDPPQATGGSRIRYYTVTANPGGLKARGEGSPITITGLTSGKTYTFTVSATNAAGTSRESRPATAAPRSVR